MVKALFSNNPLSVLLDSYDPISGLPLLTEIVP